MDWYSSSSDSETASTRAYKLTPFARLRDHPKRSATILILIALAGLLFASIFGVILSGIVFSPLTVLVEGECLGQSFVFFACILALVYIGLHIAAARQNYSIIRSQAFQHPLHSWTIIVVRLTLGTWAAALLAVAVGVAKAPTRVPLLGLDLFVTILGFLFSIVALCICERAEQPFNVPGLSTGHPILAPGTKYTCRISELDLSSNSSVSRPSSAHTWNEKTMSSGPKIQSPPQPRTMAGDVEAARRYAEPPRRIPEQPRELRSPRKIGSKATLRGPDEVPKGPRPLQRPATAHQRPSTAKSWQSDWMSLKAETGIYSTPTSRANSTRDDPGHEPDTAPGMPEMAQMSVPSVLVPGQGARPWPPRGPRPLYTHKYSKTSPIVRIIPPEEETTGRQSRPTSASGAERSSRVSAQRQTPGGAGADCNEPPVPMPPPKDPPPFVRSSMRIPGAFSEE